MKKRHMIDVWMILILIGSMAYTTTGGIIHVVLGCLLVFCFGMHLLDHHAWFHSTMKHSMSWIPLCFLLCNFMLLLDMVLIIVSGIRLSSFGTLMSGFLSMGVARRIHMITSHWGFVLIAIHLGLHMQPMIRFIKLHVKNDNKAKQIGYRIVGVLLMGYGAYQLIDRNLVSYLFARQQFIFFEESTTFIQEYIELLCMGLFVVMVSHFVFRYNVQRHITSLKHTKNKNIQRLEDQ